MITLKELAKIKEGNLKKHNYELIKWDKFDYSLLDNIIYRKRSGRGNNDTFNDIIIMADTETSKKDASVVGENHVVAFTISLRAYNRNIATLYGNKPSECVECIDMLLHSMKAESTFIYFHNLAYDWTFLRKFIMQKYGTPKKQLNTKSHYPIYIEFENGLILRDSLILAQRSLDRWANDLNVEHKKAKGKWDYDLIRNQEHEFTTDELEYIECDTLAGVECIDAMKQTLNKYIFSMPYTATGIPREDVRKIGKENNQRGLFNRICLSFEQYIKMTAVYHGGYTHGNRHMLNQLITELVTCFDFASSYPFVLLSEKYPMERFTAADNCSINDIIKTSDDYAYMFKLIMIKPRLKDDFQPMPALQFSKCVKAVNPVLDNGRILCAEYVEIYINEMDARVIAEMYDWDKHLCTEVEMAHKEYLPKWLTDYIFGLFKDKTMLKGGDAVLYALAKAKLNSVYGMMVQKFIREDIVEDYTTGIYYEEDKNPQEDYQKYLDNNNSILPYQWGVWCTAYAFHNLFQLGKCCKTWVYSDTDSCYGIDWNMDMIDEYNQKCKDKLIANGYGCVEHNNREYWLGIAELDGLYSEYKVQGAKRYCGRSTEDNELHITVAGIPKKGAVCLNNDINNFAPGLIFSGSKTGKRTHTYFYVDDIYIDKDGNETGDSIDLSECDYLLASVEQYDWERIFRDEIEIQVYDEIVN